MRKGRHHNLYSTDSFQLMTNRLSSAIVIDKAVSIDNFCLERRAACRELRPLYSLQVDVKPLAYIGKVSRTTASRGRGVFTRPFRLGGKKEAAGAVVAVMLIWIMDIE
jgi:hypothetical protein